MISKTFARNTRNLLAVTTLAFFGSVAVAEVAPDAQVKATTEEVLAVITRTGDRQALVNLAEEKVLPHFDFKRMTQVAVGRSWAKASPQQQQNLEKEFRNLLLRTYTNALAAAKTKNASVQVGAPRPLAGGDEVLVSSQVKDGGGKNVAIDYSMYRTPAGWKVFDVAVEKISLVNNYRDTFAAEISKGGVDGLVQALSDKNRASAGGRPKSGAS